LGAGCRKHLPIIILATELMYSEGTGNVGIGNVGTGNVGTGNVGTGRGLFLQKKPAIAGLHFKFVEFVP